MDWITRNLSRIAIAAIAIALVFGLLYLKSCNEARQQAAQSRVDRGQGEAFKGSAGDAINTISGVAENEAAGADTSRQNEEEIRNAKGADQRVDPDANAAGLRALCRRRSHANDPACRMLQPNPR